MAQYIPLDLIDEWEKNRDFRRINQVGEEMLESNLELGQHTTYLVKPKEDGRYTALGGNHRLRKMHSMNYTEADCKVLTYGFEENKGYYPIIDDRIYKRPDGTIPHYFQTIEELEIAMAFSHNTSPVYWNGEAVANATGNYQSINWRMFTKDFDEKVSIGDVIARFDAQKAKDAGSRFQKPVLAITFQTAQDLDTYVNQTKEVLSRFEGVKTKIGAK